MNGNQDERLAAERAADWIARLQHAGPREKAEFVRWLKESPKHVRDALIAAALDLELRRVDPERKFDVEQLAASCNVVPMHGDVAEGAPPTSSRRRWAAGVGLAAGIAAAAWLGWSARPDGWLRPDAYATTIGEQRSIQLSDGSIVSLNAQSRVRVDYSGDARDVYLDAGRALFEVERDTQRPFRVHAGEATVKAIGTKFDVHRLAGRTNIAVIEGVVEVDAHTASGGAAPSVSLEHMAERARLAAGQAVTISAAGLTAPAVLDVSEVSAWRQRRLVFRNYTLVEVVAEFARYNRTPRIRVEGEALRTKLLSGVFSADDLESFIATLAADRDIVLEQRGDDLLIRERDADPAPAAQ